MTNDRVLLVKGSAGLGNRILVLVSAILYARVTDRTLLVDWRDGLCAPGGTNALPLLFGSPPCGPLDRLPATDSIRPAVWRGHLHDSAYQMIKADGRSLDSRARRRILSVDLSRSDYHDQVLVLWDFTPQWELLQRHFHGPLATLAGRSRDDVFGAVIRKDLVLLPEIRRRIDEFQRARLGPRTLGVHVRYSDHRSSLWKILRKLNGILEREPGLGIFLATDNVEVERFFKRSYPDVVTAPRWYPRPGRPIHYAAAALDPLETTIEALVDLNLLAGCEWLIVDRSSSFSYVAKLLSTAPASQVFDVGGGEKRPKVWRDRIWTVLLHLRVFHWALRLSSILVPVRKL